MSDYNMSEADISALKETLCAQQQLLQKLYNELEAEREASATAASEALSVILRLQGEKAAVKMEAEQYKRLSEQKICHAEESLAITEDVIYQKEMEVAALDHQVQAYRYKLLSMGCVDPGFGEVKIPDNLLQRNESWVGETSGGSIGRRHSAPVSIKYKGAISERESFSIRETDLVSKTVEKTGQEMYDQVSDSDKKTDGGINSYWDQIRRLDARVKEIAGGNYTSSRSETRSPSPLSSRISSGSLCDLPSLSRKESSLCQPNKAAIMNETDQTKSSVLRNGVAADNSCSSSVHDVFEVPQVDQNLNSRESQGKDEEKTACQSSGKHEKLEREDVVYPEAVKMCARDEPDWLKKVLQSTHQESKLCQPSNIDCHLVLVQPSTSVSNSESQPTFNQVNRTSEIVEVERPSESADREEELKLLREIKQKLDSLHDEIRSLKVKESSTRVEHSVEHSLCVLQEAMLYFWL